MGWQTWSGLTARQIGPGDRACYPSSLGAAPAILTGIRPGTFAQFKQNPEQFITDAARLLNEQKAAVIVEHLTYDPLDGRYDSSIFTENQTAQDLSKAGEKLKKSVYEYVVTDSKVERDFVTELDTSTEVVVYAKLPRGFFIPTPVGDYNPDWAILKHDDKTLYLVRETKGTKDFLKLRTSEADKVRCGARHFETLGVPFAVAISADEV